MEKVQLFYKKNTLAVYAGLFLVFAVFIFLQIVLPVLSVAGDLVSQVSTQQKKLDDYKKSEAVLKKLDTAVLSHQKNITTRALPSSKDIQAIYLALTQSAASANVSVRGFTVKIGDIFKKGRQEKISTTGVPFVVVTLLVSQTDPASLYDFSQKLSKQVPLSAIVKANVKSGEGEIDIAFYYKPFDLSLINRNVIVPLSVEDQKVLGTLPDSP